MDNPEPSRPGERAVAAAMGVQGGQIPLDDDTTFRFAPAAGDYLLLVRCESPFGKPPEFEIVVFWEFREGDRLLVTNREADYPATPEQMEEGGPSLWKTLAGDRLAWVGWQMYSSERKPYLIALVNCRASGYVYGEPAIPTLTSVMSFGPPSSEMTAETRNLWMIGYNAAVALGVPPTNGESAGSGDETGLHSFGRRDRDLLEAASILLKKVAAAEVVRPAQLAQLVSVAKVMHALSRLPRATPGLDVTVSVIGPLREFDEIETWHYWDIGIEEERLFLSSGGHFYQPSTGGDSFTVMSWSASPSEEAEYHDQREALWMVPDVKTFEEGVLEIEFTSGAYRIEVTDANNDLLQDDEADASEGD